MFVKIIKIKKKKKKKQKNVNSLCTLLLEISHCYWLTKVKIKKIGGKKKKKTSFPFVFATKHIYMINLFLWIQRVFVRDVCASIHRSEFGDCSNYTWSENRVTVVKPAWFIHEYHFFLKDHMKSCLRMKISKKSLTQRFDVAMTSLSSDKIKNKNLIYRISQ